MRAGRGRLPHRTALVVFLALILAGPLVFPTRYYLTVMIFSGIHVLLALGLTLVMGYAGQISLGHAGFFGLGAYISGVLTAKFGVDPWIALLASLAVSVATALAIGIPTLQLRGYYLGMATLGFGVILHILFVELLPLTGGPSGLVGIPGLSLLGITMSTDLRYYVLVWTVVGLALLGAFHFVDSRTGRALRAIQGDETAAMLLGINTWGAKVMVFTVAAGLAALAGTLYTHYLTFLSPDAFGFMISVKLVVMVVVGGTQSIWGSVVGAMLLTILPEYLRAIEDYEVLVYGAIVVLVVMFAPSGLAGGVERWLLQRRRAVASGAGASA